MTAKTLPVDTFDLVIFGGTGDLALRKLLPGLLRRYADGQIPEDSRILGVARDRQGDAEYRAKVGEALARVAAADETLQARLPAFLDKLGYLALDATKDEGWDEFATRLLATGERIRVFYLSTSPTLFVNICDRLRAHGLNTGNARVVIEKPIGHDSASAAVINDAVGGAFAENQIFRIDHYLGKETVQNLLAPRFANILFEPLWNASRIDHVQITVAETVGLEKRAGYYDTSGALRDMVQNHLLQLLCMVAMEPPAALQADAVRDEKLKVLRSLKPIRGEDVAHLSVRGQYRAGASSGAAVPGYLEELGKPDSRTETFVALKAEVDNWRWAGVPFYLRTGKRLAKKASEILIQFKPVPHRLFNDGEANQLLIRLQPEERISLQLMAKNPGKGMHLKPVELDLNLAAAFHKQRRWEAYERLLLDVIEGDSTLFMRRDEVEAAWQWVDPILQGWHQHYQSPRPYPAGSDGPEQLQHLLERHGRHWA